MLHNIVINITTLSSISRVIKMGWVGGWVYVDTDACMSMSFMDQQIKVIGTETCMFMSHAFLTDQCIFFWKQTSAPKTTLNNQRNANPKVISI